jgi:hypothetical protein
VEVGTRQRCFAQFGGSIDERDKLVGHRLRHHVVFEPGEAWWVQGRQERRWRESGQFVGDRGERTVHVAEECLPAARLEHWHTCPVAYFCVVVSAEPIECVRQRVHYVCEQKRGIRMDVS